ncbi:MAG: hypothetical protein ABTQ34_02910 [Bdellovibrionales bacterium]
MIDIRNAIVGSVFAAILMIAAAQPNQAHAAVAGMPCDQSEIGKTEIDDNHQGIIGCLKTDDKSKQIWKGWGGTRVFSLTCEDWEESGFENKYNCITDGKWHLVYVNDANGKTTFGNYKEFIEYVQNGADVKNADAGGIHHCEVVSWQNNMASCFGGFRMAGEVMYNFDGTNKVGSNGVDPAYYLGAAVRRSDGNRVNGNIMAVPAGTQDRGNMAIKAFMRPTATDATGLRWFVRF